MVEYKKEEVTMKDFDAQVDVEQVVGVMGKGNYNKFFKWCEFVDEEGVAVPIGDVFAVSSTFLAKWLRFEKSK